MKKYLILSAVLFFVLASCRKEVTKVIHDTDKQASSAVYTILPDSWAANDDSTAFTASLEVPELNDAILDHGAVAVYLSFNDGKDYEAVPEVFNYISYNAIHYSGGVDIETRDIEGYKISPPEVKILAKVILIDAEKLALHPAVDLQNYNEVKRIFLNK